MEILHDWKINAFIGHFGINTLNNVRNMRRQSFFLSCRKNDIGYQEDNDGPYDIVL